MKPHTRYRLHTLGGNLLLAFVTAAIFCGPALAVDLPGWLALVVKIALALGILCAIVGGLLLSATSTRKHYDTRRR